MGRKPLIKSNNPDDPNYRYKGQKAYHEENTVVKTARFNYKTDSDILDWLKDKPYQTVVKDLIRKAIKYESGNKER